MPAEVLHWTTGQRLLRALREDSMVHQRVPSSSSGPGQMLPSLRAGLHVLFINRSRGIANLAELLGRCSMEPGLVCAARSFGDIAGDALAVHDAHVLVGTHASELINAFFLRRGSAVIEVH